MLKLQYVSYADTLKATNCPRDIDKFIREKLDPDFCWLEKDGELFVWPEVVQAFLRVFGVGEGMTTKQGIEITAKFIAYEDFCFGLVLEIDKILADNDLAPHADKDCYFGVPCEELFAGEIQEDGSVQDCEWEQPLLPLVY